MRAFDFTNGLDHVAYRVTKHVALIPRFGRRSVVRIGESEQRPRSRLSRNSQLAYRPFDGLQPYAETGPIFDQGACEHYDSRVLPPWFDYLDPAIIRGYGEDHWIRYETGSVVAGTELTATCQAILGDPTIAYVHILVEYNCFHCRVDRG